MISKEQRKSIDDELRAYEGEVIVTGMIELAEEEDRIEFEKLLGKEPQLTDRFNLYFHWYNLIHELGHIMRRQIPNSMENSRVLEEKLVNDFAVAYWKEYGEREKLDKVYDIVCDVLKHLNNPCGSESVVDYYSDPDRFQQATMDPNNYGFIQFTLVKESIENINHSFLEELTIQGFKANSTKCINMHIYNELNESLQYIIDDAILALGHHGITTEHIKVFRYHHPHLHCAGNPMGWSYLDELEKKHS